MNRKIDRVEEASRESFPASDPPAWGSSHAAASVTTAVPSAPVDTSVLDSRAASWTRLWTMRIASAAAALLAVTGAVLLVRRYRA